MKEADQAIAEIRAVRQRISAEHGHDIRKYIASLRRQEKDYQKQIIANNPLSTAGARSPRRHFGA